VSATFEAMVPALLMKARVDAIARDRARARLRQALFLIAVLAVVAWSVDAILVKDTDWDRLSWASVGKALAGFLILDWSVLTDLWQATLETVFMATLATLVGVFLALPVAWLGASNISPLGRFSYLVGRFLMTLSRSVHEIVWALIFVSAVGLGSLAGILALAVRSVGFISKILAEAIEDVDPKPVEAIRAAGGSKFQVLLFAILPQVVPVFLGSLIFEWDINIRRSTIMGLVGAGGLGLLLFRQMAMYNYGGVATVILAVLALILVGEIISHYARKSVI
jgi:phosphonate transport system permease protein